MVGVMVQGGNVAARRRRRCRHNHHQNESIISAVPLSYASRAGVPEGVLLVSGEWKRQGEALPEHVIGKYHVRRVLTGSRRAQEGRVTGGGGCWSEWGTPPTASRW